MIGMQTFPEAIHPAARAGACPPPIKQCQPKDSKAASRLHTAQFSGSSGWSSGCGFKIIFPSGVLFSSLLKISKPGCSCPVEEIKRTVPNPSISQEI